MSTNSPSFCPQSTCIMAFTTADGQHRTHFLTLITLRLAWLLSFSLFSQPHQLSCLIRHSLSCSYFIKKSSTNLGNVSLYICLHVFCLQLSLRIKILKSRIVLLSSLPSRPWKFLFLFTWKARGRVIKRFFSSMGSLPKRLEWLGLGQAITGSLELHPGPLWVSVRVPNAWSIICWLPGHISRQLDYNRVAGA